MFIYLSGNGARLELPEVVIVSRRDSNSEAVFQNAAGEPVMVWPCSAFAIYSMNKLILDDDQSERVSKPCS